MRGSSEPRVCERIRSALHKDWLFGPPSAPRAPATLCLAGTNERQRELILTHATEVRRFEIERLWQRSTFFWTFIGAALVAYGAIYHAGQPSRLLWLISAFGGLTSLAWTLQNRGSKYWQETWEQKVALVELSVLGVELFSNIEFRRNKGFGAHLSSRHQNLQ